MPKDNTAKQITDRVLSLSPAEQTEVSVFSEDSSLTRFANNEIHQNVSSNNISIVVRAGFGKNYGICTTNDSSVNGLQKAIGQAVAIARVLPNTEEFLPVSPPVQILAKDGFSIATAEFGPLQRAAGVRIICAHAEEQGLAAAGAFKTDIDTITVANSEGLFATHVSTSAELLAVTMSDDSSGHAGHLASDVSEINPESIAQEAVAKARIGRRPRNLPPGEYEVVLEEYAVSDMLDFLSYLGFGALALQEERSFMSNKVGSQIMSDNVSIWDDGLDSSGLILPFDYEGVPRQKVDIIEAGVAKSPVYDRRTAVKANVQSTGHALPAASTIGPLPLNLFLKPGSATREELIASVKCGLLITRFWYTRVVHPLTVMMTGMTRDGTFLIENGEVTGPVRNLRFTQSYIQALNQVSCLSKDTKLVREFVSVNRVPALKIDSWTFTGSTDS